MLPDRVSNPGPLTYESDALRLRYVANLILICPAVSEMSFENADDTDADDTDVDAYNGNAHPVHCKNVHRFCGKMTGNQLPESLP